MPLSQRWRGPRNTHPHGHARPDPIVTDRPRFTVAIPTLNRAARFLPQAMEGVLQQSFGDFELLVSDNGSSDGTEQFVRTCTDPRVRYVRRPHTLPAGEHFALAASEARGEYLVLHQDDDLLHRDFLARADAAFRAHPDAHLYAAPIWRQQHGHGYQSRLMRHQGGHDDLTLTRDELMVFDGDYAAIQFFDPIRHFVHPTLAMNNAALVAAGGFDPGASYQSDLVTQARLLLGNRLLYDPRPGGVSRVHPTNFMRGKGRDFRKRFFRNSYVELIRAFDAAGVDWQPVLARYLARLSDKEILGCLFEWTYYRAPLALQDIGFDALRHCAGSPRSYYRKCLTKLGIRNLARHALSRYIEARGAHRPPSEINP